MTVEFQSDTAQCNGICLTGYDIGLPSFQVAYAHPECELHSPETVAELHAAYEASRPKPGPPSKRVPNLIPNPDKPLPMSSLAKLAQGNKPQLHPKPSKSESSASTSPKPKPTAPKNIHPPKPTAPAHLKPQQITATLLPSDIRNLEAIMNKTGLSANEAIRKAIAAEAATLG